MSEIAKAAAHQIAQPPPHGQPYSVPIHGSQKQGRSPIYRHWRQADGIADTLDPTVHTIHEAFEQTANRAPKSKCLGHRPYDPSAGSFGPYVWQTYGEVQRRKANFGAGLRALHEELGVDGVQYGVGLWCQNRPEWQIVDLGCLSQSLFTVCRVLRINHWP